VVGVGVWGACRGRQATDASAKCKCKCLTSTSEQQLASSFGRTCRINGPSPGPGSALLPTADFFLPEFCSAWAASPSHDGSFDNTRVAPTTHLSTAHNLRVQILDRRTCETHIIQPTTSILAWIAYIV